MKMLARGVIVLLFMIVEIRGECRFATQFFHQHDQHDQNQGLCPGQAGIQYHCPHSRYRTYNGSCNNFGYPEWGMANMPLNRLMPAQYEDGVDAMRWRSVTGAHLPKARAVSLALFAEDPHGDTSPLYTFMHMTVGQFLDHDMSLVNFGANVTGCGTQFCQQKGECSPIQIPCGDPDFIHKHCLPFIRSKPVFCGHVRDQTNLQTSYIDGSNIYGNNWDKVIEMRDLYNRGQLKMSKNPFDWHLKRLMPTSNEEICREVGGAVKCFASGDPRTNAIVGLQSMHTLFHRAHNTIENKLHYLNPHWCGEKLFQESRKILSAIWQRIIYNEYIPLLMGPEASHKYDLTLEEGYNYWGGYNPNDKPDVYNEFTTGAFRFGHSQIPNKQRFTDMFFKDFKEEFIANHVVRPGALYATDLMGSSGVDAILRGMADAPAYTVNLQYAKQMTVSLLTEYPPFGEGTDLGALDIQRSRDHGLKSYNSWRRFCGLKTAEFFEGLPDIHQVNRQKLASVYKDVEDIDLLAGGLAESHLFGSMVGPTFNCILGEQFRKLRSGDRYWHETADKLAGFSPDQLKQIRKYTLSYLICENGDHIEKMQPNAMLQPIHHIPDIVKAKYGKLVNYLYRDGPNERRLCHDFYIPDLSPWKDAGDSGPACHS